MPALVAIDVPPATAPDLAAAATETCSAALGDGECVIADMDVSPRYFAVVRWGGDDGVSLRVELRGGTVEGATLDTRVISFAPADRLRQRWASAGLVVAALVAQREAGGGPAPLPRVETPPDAAPSVAEGSPSTDPASVPADLPGRAQRERWVAFDTAALVGGGLDRDSYRVGTAFRLNLAGARYPIGAFAGVRVVVRPGLPSATWGGGEFGLAVRLGDWDARVGGELRAAAAAEYLTLMASDSVSGRHDREAVWRGGGRLGMEAGVLVYQPIVLFAGVEASLLRPEVQIEVAEEPSGSDSDVGFLGCLGLRLLLPRRSGSPLPAGPGPDRL